MFLLWRLVFAHFLADFTLQSNKINSWKRTATTGMFLHCLVHPVCYLALSYPYWFEVWVRISNVPIHGLTAIVLITLLHYAEDWWRVQMIDRYHKMDNTLYLFWDQIIHLAVIFVFFGENADMDVVGIFPERWPVIGALWVLATHFSVVLTYFVEKDLYNRPYPSGLEKYLCITERTLAFFAILFLPAAKAVVVGVFAALIIPRIGVLYFRGSKSVGLPPNLSWALGSAVAVASGLLSRVLI